MNDWMDEIQGSKALANGRGVVSAIQAPVDVETSFGKRKKISFIINDKEGSTINVGFFLPAAFPMAHPKSNLGKLMSTYNVTNLKDLIGKEVLVDEANTPGMWKIRVE